MSATSGDQQYRVTKKVRKGTRSCWECKRRKIKCIYDGNEPICVGCLDRATPCISQEHPPEDQGSSSGSRLGARMGRVEALLERLMEKMDKGTADEVSSHHSSSQPPENFETDIPSSAVNFDSAPIMSLFNHTAFGTRIQSTGQPTPPESQHSSVPTPTYVAGTPPSHKQSKMDSIRRILSTLLPSQYDADQLAEGSRGWWLIRRHVLPELYVANNDPEWKTPFSVLVPGDAHPTVFARLLLIIAICIQQLPTNFDPKRLQMKSAPALMEKIVTIVYEQVVSDDELVGSSLGLECLMLSVLYQINAGNLRRSWLNSRRTVAIATLMGMHRQALMPTTQDSSAGSLASIRAKYMWFQIVKVDRYLCLILGLPSAIADAFVMDPHDDSVYLNEVDSYQRKLCLIAGLVLARNDASASSAYASTQEIDEKLEVLSKEMPESWWEIPTSACLEKTQAAAKQFDSILSQIFHFQIEALLHIPFMLKSATERRYEYSKFSCLRASREMIKRWLFLRITCASSFVCEIMDFQAFTMAVTILLGLLVPEIDGQQQQRHEDRALVVQVMHVLESLRQDENITIASTTPMNHSVASQSVDVLRTLISNLDLNLPSHPGFLKVTIPHFGTVSIARGPTISCPSHTSSLDIDQIAPGLEKQPAENLADWQQMPPPQTGLQQGTSQPTMLSFTSSQFPPMSPDAPMKGNFWEVNDADMMLFDTLVSTDVEGNWTL